MQAAGCLHPQLRSSWRGTAPINASNHGIWQTGGSWLSNPPREHYLFTRRREFLRTTALPVNEGCGPMSSSAAMVKDPKTGFLYTGPSNSPEQGGLRKWAHHGIARSCVRCSANHRTAKALNIGGDLRERLADMRKQIAPLQIVRHGQLAGVDGRRRRSQEPAPPMSRTCGRCIRGSEVTPYGSPDLFKAAQQSLIFRGDAATWEWSMGGAISGWLPTLTRSCRNPDYPGVGPKSR